jgi:cytochrome c5
MSARTVSRGFCIVLVVALGILASLPARSASKAQSQPSQTATKQSDQKDSGDARASDGEKKFKQNCSRCHEAPQELSPHISGTILRHMRVRASLSQQDERDILKFLNP